MPSIKKHIIAEHADLYDVSSLHLLFQPSTSVVAQASAVSNEVSQVSVEVAQTSVEKAETFVT